MATESIDLRGRSASDRLLEDSWEARSRRASQRELLVEAAAGALFIAAAGAFAAASGVSGVHLATAALLVATYVAVARVEFPVGAGHVVPTQLALIPMLVLLPPGIVPALVALALVTSTALDWSRGRTSVRRVVAAVPDAWHALGGAVVLAVLAPVSHGLAALGAVAAAFAACCAIDLVTSLTRMRLCGLVSDLRAPLGVMGRVCAVDAMLAPVGFAVAVMAERGALAALFVLPPALLLWGLARDRSIHIEKAQNRLALVEHERTRLQGAVRRLGDAFAANLQLTALFETLLDGSAEALDATSGRLDLTGLPAPLTLVTGVPGDLRHIEPSMAADAGGADVIQRDHEGTRVLSLPIAVAGGAHEVSGMLTLTRAQRGFEPDEVALLAELVGKAELAAGEILGHRALQAQAVTDALTGLGNRRQLREDLTAALERAEERPAVLLLFDLDGFKGYNDTFGHLAGDALLTRLAGKLAVAVGSSGTAYRLGGDEFCALLTLTDAEAIDRLVRRSADALTEAGAEFSIGASLGAVLIPHEADSADHALQVADERMYANKRSRSTGARDQARDVLMRTMHAKQPTLDEHSTAVGTLAARVGRRLGLSGEALDEIARAAELHDVGKVGIPDAILNKPAALDGDEWEFMRQHTILGERILNAAPALRPVARLVRASHERWDGSGYPDRLRGEQIPLGARIVAVCDAYVAMTTARPYDETLNAAEAVAQLRAAAGTQFDPSVVEAFVAVRDGAEAGAAIEIDRLDSATASAHIRALLAGEPGSPAAGVAVDR